MVGILHLFDHDFLHFLLFLWINGEVEFVVYLDNHLALDALRLETIEDAHHRHLDDVRLRTLDRGVDGIALGKSTYSSVSTADVWQITACGFNLRSSGPSSRKEKPRFGSSICIEETPRSASTKSSFPAFFSISAIFAKFIRQTSHTFTP